MKQETLKNCKRSLGSCTLKYLKSYSKSLLLLKLTLLGASVTLIDNCVMQSYEDNMCWASGLRIQQDMLSVCLTLDRHIRPMHMSKFRNIAESGLGRAESFASSSCF